MPEQDQPVGADPRDEAAEVEADVLTYEADEELTSIEQVEDGELGRSHRDEGREPSPQAYEES